jgi:hypothetical protein
LCDYKMYNIADHINHLNTASHKAKKELKYMTLKFEDKLNDAKIKELFIELENSFV